MRFPFVATAAIVLIAASCGGGGDPFEQGPWDIKLQNDTAHAVVVKDCATQACDRFRYSKTLPPKKTAAALDYGDRTSWWLVTAHGERLGCLTLDISKRVEGYVLRVSTMSACPRPS